LAQYSSLPSQGSNERWALFLWMFAFWDIFYYLGHWLIIRWPPSVLTQDVLFLIPIPLDRVGVVSSPGEPIGDHGGAVGKSATFLNATQWRRAADTKPSHNKSDARSSMSAHLRELAS
jgi:hypothetical protein